MLFSYIKNRDVQLEKKLKGAYTTIEENAENSRRKMMGIPTTKTFN